VVFDPYGNLWVANYGASNGGANGSIAEYSNGVQNTANSITNGILNPQAMAIDKLGTLWVQNNDSYLTVYITNNNLAVPNSIFKTLPFQDAIYGVAIANGTIAYGGNNGTIYLAELNLLNGDFVGSGRTPPNGFILNNDNQGGIYDANSDGSIGYYFNLFASFLNIHVNYLPTGIAVDNARGWLYISNYSGNWIDIYDTQGSFLYRIQ
jgi:hypothetical protein